jgi:glycosyltransferase involved in cell wall biosynthesis
MKKLTVLFQSFEGGGVEKVLINLVNSLKDHYQITILVLEDKGNFKKEIAKDINVIPINKPRAFHALPFLISFLRKEKPDIFFSAKHFLNITALIAKSIVINSNTKMVAGVHGQLNPVTRKMEVLIKKLYPKANKIICVSKGVAVQINEITNRKIEQKVIVIPNPVITKDFVKKAENVNDENQPEFRESSKKVVAVGRLSQEKNLRLLINSFYSVSSKFDTELIIVGDGPERENLINIVKSLGIEQNVHFTGFQTNPYKYLKMADVYCLSSNSEGLPTVLIEALYFKKPIVSTDCKSGPDEILKHGKYGYLVPVGIEREYAAALEKALQKEDLPVIDEKAIENYKSEKVVSEYIKEFEKM